MAPRLYLTDERGDKHGYKHFLVETPQHTYQGVEFHNGQVVVKLDRRFGFYDSIEECCVDLTRVASANFVSCKVTGDYQRVLTRSVVTREEGS